VEFNVDGANPRHLAMSIRLSRILLHFFNGLQSFVKRPDVLCRALHGKFRCVGRMYKK
jgi:hypothetical protein